MDSRYHYKNSLKKICVLHQIIFVFNGKSIVLRINLEGTCDIKKSYIMYVCMYQMRGPFKMRDERVK